MDMQDARRQSMIKRFKSIEEQQGLLEERGVKVDEKTLEILEREGYYAVVVGYKAPFLNNPRHPHSERDSYRPGTTFDQIFSAFCFDRKLRMTMLNYAMIAESTLKVLEAYAFEKHHRGDEHAFLERRSYARSSRDSTVVRRLISTFSEVVRRESPYDDRTYLYDYMEELKRVPFWVVTKVIDFGQALDFARFVSGDVQKEVVDGFASLYEKSWGRAARFTWDGEKGLDARLMRIKDLRNSCAHDERLYCARFGRQNEANLVQVIGDLSFVLERGVHERMMVEVQTLLEELDEKAGAEAGAYVRKEMGWA